MLSLFQISDRRRCRCKLAIGAVAAAPVVLTAAGFTTCGVAASSLGAWAMSRYGGAVPAGGLVVTLQSAGAAGLGVGGKAAVAAAGGYLGAKAGAGANKRKADCDEN